MLAVALLVLVTRASASQGGESADWKTIEVTATSFTLAEDETKRSNVGVTASGVKVKPSSKAIAVSRDLLHEGLDYGTKVRIKDLPGTYTVRDTMHRRWHDKIDILFAKKKRALEWGRKDIEIQYHVSDSQ